MAVELGSVVGYLDLDTKKFSEGLESAQSQANSTLSNISRKLEGIGKTFTDAGKKLSLAVTTPIIGLGTAVTKMGSDFEAQMSKVKAISGSSEEDFKRLEERAKELGATTVFSASQVAEGMSEMAKAGWDADKIIDGMQGVLNAASASGENLANVSTIVADAITGFGLEANDATRVADLLTQAANSGTIDINDLGESFKYIAPLASSMGLEIEDVTTALSAMSQAGIKGSQAGTSLRTLLLRMADPSAEVAKLMENLNIKITNADGTFKSMNEIVDVLRTSFSGMTDDQRAYSASVLAGQEGSAGLLSLLNQTEEAYNEISDSMRNANGVAEETANVMLDNLQGSLTILKSQLEGLAIQLYEIIVPVLSNIIEKISNLVTWFSSLSEQQKEQIVKIAAIAAAIGPLLIAIGKISTGISSVISSVSKLNSTVGILSNPYTLVIAALAAVSAAIVYLWNTNEDFRKAVITIWENVKDSFVNFSNHIVEKLDSLGIDFNTFKETVLTIWNEFCNLLGPIITGAFESIQIILQTALDLIIDVLGIFINLFKGDWEGAWENAKVLFSDVWNGISNIFSTVINALKDTLNIFLGWFGTSWEELWDNTKNLFVSVWDAITSSAISIVTSMVDIGKNIVEGLWKGIKSTGNWLKDKVTSFFSKPVQWAKEVLGIHSPSTVFAEIGHNLVLGLNKGMLDSSTSLEEAGSLLAVSVSKSLMSSLGIALSSWQGFLFSIGVNLLNTFASAFFNNWDTSKSIGENIVLGIWEGIKSTFSFIWNMIKGLFSGIFNGIKKLFGIKSPSKKFAYIGEMMAKGLGIGFEEEIKGVTKSIKSSMSGITNAMSFNNPSMQYALAATSSGGIVMGYNAASSNNRISNDNRYRDRNDIANGDTFIFNSPKKIDEIEAARLLKKTKRDISEGF